MLGRNSNYLPSEKPVNLTDNTGLTVYSSKIFIAHFYIVSTATAGQFVMRFSCFLPLKPLLPYKQ